MAEVASAFVSIMPSAKGFGSKLDGQIGGDLDKTGKKRGLSFGKLFAAGAALGIGAKAFSFLGDSLGEATEAQVVGARTENVIKKMGDAANISAEGVGRLAGAISKKTGIDDEAIQSGQNLLLTFGNIKNEAGKGNDIFNQTSKLMVDLSAAMGTDAKGSAVQLGKALNDPVKGITSLTRAGVQFTDKQKNQIAGFVKSGDTMKAQKVILGELERQFGGAAKSMATPGDKAAVAFGNLKEQIGTAVLPVVEKLSRTFTNDIAPAVSTFISQMQSGKGAGGEFVASLTSAKDVLVDVAGRLKELGGFLLEHRTALVSVAAAVLASVAAYKAFVVLNTVMKAIQTGIVLFKAWRAGTLAQTAAQLGLNGALIANPIGLLVVALVGLVAGLVVAYKKSETFRNIVDGALSAVADAGKALWEKALKPAFEKLKDGFEAVGKAGTWLWNNALQPAFKFIVSGVASILELWASMLGVLAKVPGFGWAKDAADAMANAAEKARGFADGIKKIPTTKKITITTYYMTRNIGKEKSMGDDFLPRAAGLPGAKDADRLMDNYGGMTMEAFGRGIIGGGKKTREQLTKQLDKLKGVFATLQDDFAALAESVSSAFIGDLFGVSAIAADSEAGIAGKTVGQNFIDSLLAKKGELTSLLASFKTLQGWGIPASFLSQLFASGNGALVTELAGMGQAGAVGAANLFGEVTSLGTQLGSAVATNDIGPNIDRVGEEIKGLRQDIKKLPKEISKANADTRIVLEGGSAGQRAYLRTGK